MPHHWAVDECATYDIPQRRAAAHVQDSFHSPEDKYGSAQKAVIRIVRQDVPVEPVVDAKLYQSETDRVKEDWQTTAALLESSIYKKIRALR